MKAKNIEGKIDGELSLIEGVLYLSSKPISIKKLSSIIKISITEVEAIIERLKEKYKQLKCPFQIKITKNVEIEKNKVELKLSEKVLKSLASYDFFSTQELPAKYFRDMSCIMLLEYVKNKKIDKKLLQKEFKIDKDTLEKKLKVLIHHGYLRKTQDYYTTTDRFLRKMGLPIDREEIQKALKDKTIQYALKFFGLENAED